MKTLEQLKESANNSLKKYNEMNNILLDKSNNLSPEEWLKLNERANKTEGAIKRTYYIFLKRYYTNEKETTTDPLIKKYFTLFSIDDAIRNHVSDLYLEYGYEYVEDMNNFIL